MTMVERVARAIADQIGDGFDNVFRNKPEWVQHHGEKLGRFRDVNEPYQADYLAAARAAIAAMRDYLHEAVTNGVVADLEDCGYVDGRDAAVGFMQEMIDAALNERPEAE